jgi:PucR family transcriptional regulator, purine catabolism regulatory protein
LRLADAKVSTILRKAHLAAGENGLQREIRWVHIVDMPDILPWVGPGQLLLTTGYSWPREEAAQRALIRALAEQNLAGVGLAVPRFFDHFPEAFCDEANRYDLPLLEIPWEIPFALITEELHTAILAEQTRLIEQSETIHRTLTRAALEVSSLQELAAILGELIHRSITFEDQDGRLLGYYTVPGLDDDARHATIQQGSSPHQIMARLDALGYLQQMNTALSPVRIPAFPDLNFSGRIVCPIRIRDEIVGRVWMIEGDTPLSDLDLRAAEHAAVIAALQITHQRALASLEARVGYSFMTALLEGRFEDTPHTLERAQLQGFSPEGVYHVGMLVMNEEVPLSREGVLRRDRLAERLRQRLQWMGIKGLISVSLNQIPFLLPQGSNADGLWTQIQSSEIAFGLSRAYCGVDGVKQGYQEVLAMTPHLRFGAFQRFDDLLLPRVLSGDLAARAAFLEQLFGALRRSRNGSTLVTTLVAFAASGFRLKTTAEKLHIHPKSLRYRLERIAEITRFDFHDPDTRFRLQLAAQLLSQS